MRNLLERLMLLLGKRKPPARRATVQIGVGMALQAAPVPAWRMPVPDELDYARAQVLANDSPHVNCVKVCRGRGKGCSYFAPDNCGDCYKVFWHDTRPSAEILAAMERGDG